MLSSVKSNFLAILEVCSLFSSSPSCKSAISANSSGLNSLETISSAIDLLFCSVPIFKSADIVSTCFLFLFCKSPAANCIMFWPDLFLPNK